MTPISITVGNAPRGGWTQPPLTFPAQSIAATFSWGLQPGTATVVYVGDNAPVTAGAEMTITIGEASGVHHTLRGVCISDIAEAGTGGITRTLRFEDMRHYLTWDDVFCAFNMPEVRLVGNKFIKRYWHIYPDDYTAYKKTFTLAPLTAAEILDAIFGASTVGSPWVRTYHATQSEYPIFQVDFLAGEQLGSAIQQISDKQGLLFTIKGGAYSLVWTRKGEGQLPEIPALSDNRKMGVALSSNPTRIRIVGDRNLYQVMNIVMEPDWSSMWEVFWDFEVFAEWVYWNCADIQTGIMFRNTASDPEQYIGRQLARAAALTMTVQDVVRETGNTAFADYRKFSGRCRMNMPAALYINRILFRAFRPPFDFTFMNLNGDSVNMDSVVMTDRLLCRVSHDPVNGGMAFYPNEPMDGNGYAIAQGYQIGMDAFRTLRPEQFNAAQWSSRQVIWQHVPFQIDDSGDGIRFILFAEPVIRSDNMVTQVDGKAVFVANPTLYSPPVKATLVFEAEKFIYTCGTGSRDGRENVSGLRGEYVSAVDNSITEVLYADGESVDDKAAAIGQSLLLRQFSYVEGGFKYVNGVLGSQLSGVVDRVTVPVNTSEGTYEQVDYTNERRHNAFVPEREFERKTVAASLFPGQSELREQANQARLLAAGFKQNPGFVTELSKALHGQIGSGEPLTTVTIESGAGTLPVGTPLFKPTTVVGADGKATGTRVAMPANMGTDHTVFVGVTVREGESATSPVRVQSNGGALVRVQGPVNVNDPVGRSTGNDYLVANGDVPIGMAQEAIGDASVKLISVRLGMGAGGGDGGYLPVWI